MKVTGVHTQLLTCFCSKVTTNSPQVALGTCAEKITEFAAQLRQGVSKCFTSMYLFVSFIASILKTLCISLSGIYLTLLLVKCIGNAQCCTELWCCVWTTTVEVYETIVTEAIACVHANKMFLRKPRFAW